MEGNLIADRGFAYRKRARKEEGAMKQDVRVGWVPG